MRSLLLFISCLFIGTTIANPLAQQEGTRPRFLGSFLSTVGGASKQGLDLIKDTVNMGTSLTQQAVGHGTNIGKMGVAAGTSLLGEGLGQGTGIGKQVLGLTNTLAGVVPGMSRPVGFFTGIGGWGLDTANALGQKGLQATNQLGGIGLDLTNKLTGVVTDSLGNIATAGTGATKDSLDAVGGVLGNLVSTGVNTVNELVPGGIPGVGGATVPETKPQPEEAVNPKSTPVEKPASKSSGWFGKK